MTKRFHRGMQAIARKFTDQRGEIPHRSGYRRPEITNPCQGCQRYSQLREECLQEWCSECEHRYECEDAPCWTCGYNPRNLPADQEQENLYTSDACRFNELADKVPPEERAACPENQLLNAPISPLTAQSLATLHKIFEYPPLSEIEKILPPEPTESIAPCGDHVDCSVCINREDCRKKGEKSNVDL